MAGVVPVFFVFVFLFRAELAFGPDLLPPVAVVMQKSSVQMKRSLRHETKLNLQQECLHGSSQLQRQQALVFLKFLYPVLAAACWKFLLLTAGWLQDVHSRWMICHQVIDRLQAVASTNHTPTTVAQQHSDDLIVFHVLSVFSTLTRERQKKKTLAPTPKCLPAFKRDHAPSSVWRTGQTEEGHVALILN